MPLRTNQFLSELPFQKVIQCPALPSGCFSVKFDLILFTNIHLDFKPHLCDHDRLFSACSGYISNPVGVIHFYMHAF